jgi:hypothetical protein
MSRTGSPAPGPKKRFLLLGVERQVLVVGVVRHGIFPQMWVPHLCRSFIAAKVGYLRSASRTLIKIPEGNP